MNVLVFNVGSTTLKYACIETATGETRCGGLVDKIGQPAGDAPTHQAATEIALRRLESESFDAIAHRIVQGGDKFHAPTLVTPGTLERLRELDDLAPLHNPSARKVVEAIANALPELKQTLVFDTAYFATLAPAAYRYAIPTEIADRYGIRRYGFHGTSHQYVVQQTLNQLDTNSSSAKIISLHLGGGASVTASIGGVAVDTSMGMTPLEGLMMATRCGDLDPSIPLFLIRHVGMSPGEVDRLLNAQSGLLGMCGDGDMRTVLTRASRGDESAQLAINIYVRKIVKTIGSYYAILGGLDALVFTAGVGEHSAEIRQRICESIGHLGITIDPVLNRSDGQGINDFSASGSVVKTLVVPTNEELAIALQVAQQSPLTR